MQKFYCTCLFGQHTEAHVAFAATLSLVCPEFSHDDQLSGLNK